MFIKRFQTGIRTHLLDSEEHKCPACSTINVSPDNLLPNRYLRTKVLRYKNEKSNYFSQTVSTTSLKVPSSTVDTNNRSPVKSPNVAETIKDEDEQPDIVDNDKQLNDNSPTNDELTASPPKQQEEETTTVEHTEDQQQTDDKKSVEVPKDNETDDDDNHKHDDDVKEPQLDDKQISTKSTSPVQSNDTEQQQSKEETFKESNQRESQQTEESNKRLESNFTLNHKLKKPKYSSISHIPLIANYLNLLQLNLNLYV